MRAHGAAVEMSSVSALDNARRCSRRTGRTRSIAVEITWQGRSRPNRVSGDTWHNLTIRGMVSCMEA